VKSWPLSYPSLYAVVLLCTFALSATAQRISNFSVSQNGNVVTYRFIFSAGASCQGYQLLHSSDSLTYLTVKDYVGICGASGAAEPFDGVHEFPVLNAWNYYKIQMATFEQSEVRRIFVTTDGKLRATVFPNPSFSETDQVRFRLSGVNNIRVQGFVHDQLGITRDFIDTVTAGDSAALNLNNYENGFYFLWLTDGTRIYTGRIVLIR
jgi:hypothetical protein